MYHFRYKIVLFSISILTSRDNEIRTTCFYVLWPFVHIFNKLYDSNSIAFYFYLFFFCQFLLKEHENQKWVHKTYIYNKAKIECHFILCGKVKHELRVTSSNPRVTNSSLRVQIHELRVQIHELRLQIHELRVQIHELQHWKRELQD